MYRQILYFVLFLALLSWSPGSIWAKTTSSNIYNEVEKSVFQVRVINKKTGKKTTIGSGFIVGRADVLATNYHVVSTYVNDPETYELDYLSTSGDSGSLTLLDVDVVRDLAVVKADAPLGKVLKISTVPEKGATLYSLGNPLDLGFSIVTGTNNGVLKYSEDGNILFSGSLNAGMSGGPTLNEDGQVVGVNVATSGNEISFLVSAKYLAQLLDVLRLRKFTPHEDLSARIASQLNNTTQTKLQRLSQGEWSRTRIGDFDVPAELGRSVRCWDNPGDYPEDALIQDSWTVCSNESEIYLEEGLDVGGIHYQYIWYETENLFPARFYRAYERKNTSQFSSNANRYDVTNFRCHTGFPEIATKNFKMTICRRDYLKYKGLSDMMVTGAMVGEPRSGFIFNLDMTGTDFESAMKLLNRMLEAFQWRN